MVTAEETLTVCPKCDGTGRIEPDATGYDGCDRCNYGDGPTGFVPDSAVRAIFGQELGQ